VRHSAVPAPASQSGVVTVVVALHLVRLRIEGMPERGVLDSWVG